MAKTLFEQTERSPLVTFDGDELLIKGRSFMDDAAEFYRNLIASIANLGADSLAISVALDYFNTSSSKCLLELFRAFEKMNKAGKNYRITWFYEENCPDIEEAGEDYRDLMTDLLPFEIVCLEN